MGYIMDSDTVTSAPTNTQQNSGPAVPQAWPGAFGAYKYSRDAVKFNLGTIIGLILASLAISLLLGGRSNAAKNGLSLVADLINVWFSAALVVTFLAGVRSTKIGFGDALKRGGNLYLKYLGLSIATALVLFVSFILLIVPFFFVLPRVALAGYFVADKNMGPIEALKASWAQTKGHSSKVWGIIGATIAMAILIVVLVGIYFLVMYSAAYALLYVYLQNNSTVTEETVPATNPVPAETPAA